MNVLLFHDFLLVIQNEIHIKVSHCSKNDSVEQLQRRLICSIFFDAFIAFPEMEQVEACL
jgi:hypothetical protein